VGGAQVFVSGEPVQGRHQQVAANKRDVPYQSLIKVWLSEKLDAD